MSWINIGNNHFLKQNICDFQISDFYEYLLNFD